LRCDWEDDSPLSSSQGDGELYFTPSPLVPRDPPRGRVRLLFVLQEDFLVVVLERTQMTEGIVSILSRLIQGTDAAAEGSIEYEYRPPQRTEYEYEKKDEQSIGPKSMIERF
jgi:hypothetical protein